MFYHDFPAPQILSQSSNECNAIVRKYLITCVCALSVHFYRIKKIEVGCFFSYLMNNKIQTDLPFEIKIMSH